MANRLRKLVIFALAGLFAMAPVAFAQAQPSPTPGPGGVQRQSERPGMPGTPSQMGVTGAQETISATIEKVDKKDKTVTLKTQDDKTVKLQAPERLLSGLQEGDRVQVSMEKQDAIFATVEEVDKEDKTAKLKMQGGDTVELQASERLLSDLQEGDSVRVSIRKMGY